MIALVTGATGFVGREVVKALCSRDIEVRCLVHSPASARVLSEHKVDLHYGSVEDPASLEKAVHDVDVVLHLVAVIRESKSVTFQGVNRKGTENVVEAARSGGAKHFVHVSAIGVADDPAYPYLYSKWQGEQAVIKSGIPYTILRPSLLFGEGDEFFNILGGLVRAFPVVPIPGSGKNTFQPVAVDELAQCVAGAVGRDELMGKTIEVGGPEHLTHNDIIDIISRTFGTRRLKLHIPVPIMGVMVRLMEVVLSRPPVTTQQLRMAAIPNVGSLNTVEEAFGFKPRPLEGSLDYIKSISFFDGLKISLGAMPRRIRDH